MKIQRNMPGTFHVIFKGFSLNLSSSVGWVTWVAVLQVAHQLLDLMLQLCMKSLQWICTCWFQIPCGYN